MVENWKTILQTYKYFFSTTNYKKYVLLRVTDSIRKYIQFENNELVQQVVTNTDNSSYFYTNEAAEIFPQIFEKVNIQFKSTCSSNILKTYPELMICLIAKN